MKRNLRIAVLACAVAVVASAHATTPPLTFAPPTGFPLPGIAPRGITTGDYNGDGRLDVVTAISLSDMITMSLGDGAGGFGQPTTFSVGSGLPVDVAAADFDEDGNLDVALANLSGVSILLGDGAGGFDAPMFVPLPGARAFGVGELNGDGNVDLAVSRLDNTVSTLLGNGSGDFTVLGTFPTDEFPQSIVVGDFDGDGNLDVATANTGATPPDYPSSVTVLLGDGTGALGPKASFDIDARPWQITSGDFNSDGNVDVATANAFEATVSILLGDGTGGFGAPSAMFVDGFPSALTAADLDSDGHVDVAVDNSGFGVAQVLRGDGNGGFEPPVSFPSGGGVPIVAADVNGDSQLDLVTLGNSDFWVLLNTTPLSAATLVANLEASLSGIGGGSFASQLQSVQNSLADDHLNAACNKLAAFRSHVTAQSGGQLSVTQADQVLAAVARIEALIGCG